MTEIKDSQFSFLPDGRVGFQPDPTNPTPGAAFAAPEKGAGLLSPRLSALPDGPGGLPEGLLERANQWLDSRVAAILEPITLLEKAENLSPAMTTIAAALIAGLGAAAREDLRPSLGALTPEDRQILRARKIRSGSLHVYFPEMKKPAAVRLRALLWALWHDAPLPPPLPHDGAVSVPRLVDAPDLFAAPYWLAIGYPLCGDRLVRIDMLDRLVGAVYDGAEKGTFRATHTMAEWLGVNIETLYAVLESLGHRRVEETPAPEAASPVGESFSPAESGSPPVDEVVPEPSAPVSVRKPELALFRLARPVHPVSAPRRPARAEQGDSAVLPEGEKSPRKGGRDSRRREGGGHDRGEASGKPKFERKSGGSSRREDGRKPSFDRKQRGAHEDRAERPERVIRAEVRANPDDSPFSILRQLVTTERPSDDTSRDIAGAGQKG
ncbi:MAG: hypothetical protein H6862_04560 [Rhodospirillales bacterium]|nr:hypothetical protein [Rhodospirillales bacterium]